MSLRGVQRQAAARYGDLGADLASTVRRQKPKHRTGDLTTTARLLRNSRLFSLPKPLPRPSLQDENAKSGSESPTATLPYPTHATVVTPASSLSRGDWGFKRPLPSKALRTSTPVIRVNNIDTIDHITDFESASDHVFTLQKWQEMHVPLTAPKGSRRTGFGSEVYSAFDPVVDPKELPASAASASESKARGDGAAGWGVEQEQVPQGGRRWRYSSPWVAGMDQGEFEEYIRSSIKKRRLEFRDWLRRKLAEKKAAADKRPAIDLDAGLGAADEPEAQNFAAEVLAEAVTTDASMPANDTLEADILSLRKRPRQLFEYIWEFLDLPGQLPGSATSLRSYADSHVDSDQGPAKTHPSAGLSYLRPVRQIANHAALGPMALDAPVEARVLQRPGGGGAGSGLVLGVGGVAVAQMSAGEPRRDALDRASTIAGLRNPGGPRLWVHPADASVDADGRVRLAVTPAHEDSKDVWNPPGGLERPAAPALPGRRLDQMPDLAAAAATGSSFPSTTTTTTSSSSTSASLLPEGGARIGS